MILYLAGYKPCAKRWNLDTKDIYLLSSFGSINRDIMVVMSVKRNIFLIAVRFQAFSGKNNKF